MRVERPRTDTGALRPITDLYNVLRDRPNRPIWTDSWSLSLAVLGVAVNAALAIVLWQRFESFPELIALHFNAFGEADLIGSKNEIFKLPVIGAAVFASNAAIAVVSSPHDRVLARAALGIALFVQVMICAGTWRILT